MQNEIERLKKYIIAGYQQTDDGSAEGPYGIFLEKDEKVLSVCCRYDNQQGEKRHIQEDYGTDIKCTYEELFKPWSFDKEIDYVEVFEITSQDTQKYSYILYEIKLENELEPFLKILLSSRD